MRIKGIWRLFLAFLSYHSSVCLHIIWVVYEILLSHVLCHTMIICRLLAHFIAAFISASKFSMPENVDSTAQMWLCVDLQRENIQIRVENPINMWQLASVLLSLYTNICHSFRCIWIRYEEIHDNLLQITILTICWNMWNVQLALHIK